MDTKAFKTKLQLSTDLNQPHTHTEYSHAYHSLYLFFLQMIYWLKIVKFKGKMKKSHKLQGIQTQFNHFLPATSWQIHPIHDYTRRDYIHHDDYIYTEGVVKKKNNGKTCKKKIIILKNPKQSWLPAFWKKIQNIQEIKRMLFNQMEQDKTCKFSM